MNILWRHPFPADLLTAVEQLDHQALLGHLNGLATAQKLTTGWGRPLSFQPAASQEGPGYERFIAETGQVPTRDNLHDRYNALIWLSLPRTKAGLNQAQADAIARQSGHLVRGPVRDALTLWDENLLVITATSGADELDLALAQHDWTTVFHTHRTAWYRDWQPIVFGHALLEKLSRPFKSITAHVLVLECGRGLTDLDEALMLKLTACLKSPGGLATSVFRVLPVMGIPGWHADNIHADFYRDEKVFRPASHLRQAT
jgi:hypothetical protein